MLVVLLCFGFFLCGFVVCCGSCCVFLFFLMWFAFYFAFVVGCFVFFFDWGCFVLLGGVGFGFLVGLCFVVAFGVCIR